MSPLLEEFGPSIWKVEGPVVNFFGCPYPTRIVVIQLDDDGSTWIWSPVALTEELKAEMTFLKLDNVKYVVSPNKIHHIFLKEWQDAFPKASFYAPPGLRDRYDVAKDVRFDMALTDDEETMPYRSEIRQVIVRGSFFMEEVAFYHIKSKTALICDLIQRFPEEKGFVGTLMKIDGLVGKDGSTPREWRFSFLTGKEAARKARDVIVKDWKPEKLIIAHGECVADGTATEVISKALGWLDQFHALW
jgi:hypothetical protein